MKEGSIQLCKGRAFQAKRTVSSKALRWKHAWNDRAIARRPAHLAPGTWNGVRGKQEERGFAMQQEADHSKMVVFTQSGVGSYDRILSR